jgi:hypothetical protein
VLELSQVRDERQAAYMAIQAGNNEDLPRRRFLCPHCLQFAGLEHACSVCKSKIAVDLDAATASLAGHCSKCDMAVFSDDSSERWFVWTYCSRCGLRVPNRDALDNTPVRIVAALHPSDFELLATSAIKRPRPTYAVIYDEVRLTYVLNISLFPDAVLPRAHAINALEAIWLDAASHDALEFGRHLDRLVRRVRRPGQLMQTATVCLSQSEVERATLDRLESVCRSYVFGVTAEEFLSGAYAARQLIDAGTEA